MLSEPVSVMQKDIGPIYISDKVCIKSRFTQFCGTFVLKFVMPTESTSYFSKICCCFFLFCAYAYEVFMMYIHEKINVNFPFNVKFLIS